VAHTAFRNPMLKDERKRGRTVSRDRDSDRVADSDFVTVA
jgi:hypothetical protein